MFKVELTPNEERMFALVQNFSVSLPDKERLEILNVQVELFDSLIGRNAIPKHRLSWFLDPRFSKYGQDISRKSVFEKNGTARRDILHDPHFNAYLKYFVNGPNLSIQLMESFCTYVVQLGLLTSGDYKAISIEARRLVRAHGYNSQVSDEIFKLCFEAGIEPLHAKDIRKSIVQMR